MDITVSSKKAADYLKVNESTVKRWADNGILNCVKTPGGHRKYKIEDLKLFAKNYEYETNYLNLENDIASLQKDIRIRNYKNISKSLQKYILKGNDESAYKILYTLYINNCPLHEIFDLVVKESMKNVGDLWKDKIIGVQNEHIASNSIITALNSLDKVIQKNESIKKTAVCAALEGELHGIGLLCVKIYLNNAGWNVIYPGINLPYRSLTQLVLKLKPDLVCLSSINYTKELERQVKEVNKAVKKNDGVLLLGGENIKAESLMDINCKSISELEKIIIKI